MVRFNGVIPMRWITLIAGLFLTAAATIGCSRPIYLSQSDLQSAKDLDMPARVETDPKVAYEADEKTLVAEPAKFDTFLQSALNFSTTDQPIGSALQTIQSSGSANTAIKTQAAEFKTA